MIGKFIKFKQKSTIQSSYISIVIIPSSHLSIVIIPSSHLSKLLAKASKARLQSGRYIASQQGERAGLLSAQPAPRIEPIARESQRGVTESILSSVNKALFRKLIRNFQLQNFIPCLFSKFHPMIFKHVPINFKYVPIKFKHFPILYQFKPQC